MSTSPMNGNGRGFRGQDRSRPWRTDDSARCVPPPSTHPSASRTFRPLHTCTQSTRGNSGTTAEAAWKTTSGSRVSKRAKPLSYVQFREPERSKLGLGAQLVERHFERSRAGDQDHVISYSQAEQGRIRSEQFETHQLAQPAPGSIAQDRALHRPAHGDTNTVLVPGAGDRRRDQAPTAEDTLPANRGLELALPAKPVTPLHPGGAVSCSGADGPCDAGSAPRARRHVRSSGAESRGRGGGSVSSVGRFA